MPPALENPLVLWFVLTAVLAGLAYAFMRPELRPRAILYGGFLLACGVAMWPPFNVAETPGKIKLGLDLRGGMHLVMQVVVDDAMNATIDDGVQTVRDQLSRKGVTFTGAQRVDTTSFSVEGVEPARVKDARDVLKDFFREGWEVREAGEGRFRVQMTTPLRRRQIRDRTVQGGDQDARAPGQPARRSRAGHRRLRQPGRPDPGPASGRDRSRRGQARDQDAPLSSR